MGRQDVIGACQNLNTGNVFWMNQVQMRQSHRKVESGRRVVGAIKSLQLQCARVLHESLFMPVLMYDRTMIWKEKSRIRAVQMDNLRGL